MANEVLNNDFFKNEFSAVFGPDQDKQMPAHYFLANYINLMKRYLSDGNPSEDTIASYRSSIDQFLSWCKVVNVDPFKVTEQQMIYYRSVLVNKGYKMPSIKFKLTCIRRFYYVAIKYNLVKENPAEDIKTPRNPDAYIPVLEYLTIEQLRELIESIDIVNERSLRIKAEIYLMAIEGLRTVEVHRMNTQDINFQLGAIYIRGKGHNDMIYPSEDTMKILSRYINMRTAEPTYPTPVFTSTSNNCKGKRITRANIRVDINKALDEIELKQPGKACHLLRHTCGTLLYQETNDLQVVKSVLRHRSIEMTSKYSHIQDAMLNRYTSAIPIHEKEKK